MRTPQPHPVVLRSGLLGVLVLAFAATASVFAGDKSDAERWDRLFIDNFDRADITAHTVATDRTAWKLSRLLPAKSVKSPDGDGSAVLIQGTDQRNNPLRRGLAEPYTADELYVSFTLHYDGATIDQATSGKKGDEGEFFVLWLDDIDGSDGALHNRAVPNIGLHVAERGKLKGRNVFMLRIGNDNVAFTDVELQGDHTYRIVGRLSKIISGATARFERFEMWVDPDPDKRDTADAVVTSGRSVNLVSWLGFSTGRKTEKDDRIIVDELRFGRTWQSVLDRPAPDEDDYKPKRLVEVPEDAPPPEPIPAVDRVSFREQVYPILKSRCFECHRGTDAEGGIRLDMFKEVMGHSTGQPLAVPGEAAKSLIIEKVTEKDPDERMPAKGEPLTAEQVDVLKKWINQGLAWDDGLLPPTQLASDHWSFQPIERPEVPKQPKWGHNPIDAFIAAKQRELDVEPVKPADRRTLIRRAYLDLVGLLPEPSEIEAFVGDQSSDAYPKLIDRLLKSPAHGERWARHWLDLARWAESNGHQHNRPRAHAFRYRDYVIEAFRSDKPYDQFLREQIAGDELTPYEDENLIATGYLAGARLSGNELDKEVQRHDILIDIANNTASVTMGLTMECAQCHNHKFDPISIRDYYRFYGFFVKGQPGEFVMRGDGKTTPRAQALIRQRTELFEKVEARLVSRKAKRQEGAVLVIPKNVRRGMNDEEKKLYNTLGSQIDQYPRTFAFSSPITASQPIAHKPMEIRWPLDYEPAKLAAAQPRLLLRGDLKSKGPALDVGWPAIFGPIPDDAPIEKRPRTVLANWLASPDNPLTARVWANRVWMYHTGKPLVATPSDFGEAGAEPTHPKLLDYLASELIDSGWSTHHLHRLIMQSATYQLSAKYNEANNEQDPENLTYWRWTPRRMEGEIIRDTMLQVAGQLDTQVGGPSVPANKVDQSHRRSIYMFQDRNVPTRMAELFDGPNMIAVCSRREVSTVAPQPLFLLNNPQSIERARRFAQRVRQLAGDDRDKQIDWCYRLALGREPEPGERAEMLDYLAFAESQANASSLPPLAQLCQTVMNLNEFVYIP